MPTLEGDCRDCLTPIIACLDSENNPENGVPFALTKYRIFVKAALLSPWSKWLPRRRGSSLEGSGPGVQSPSHLCESIVNDTYKVDREQFVRCNGF